MKKIIRFMAVITLIIILIVLLGFISPLKLTKYNLSYDNLPEAFEGYKILQITDFHCQPFGEKEKPLIKMVEKAQPDLIVLTGDIVDEKHLINDAEYMIAGLVEIAPVYYVSGNHEYRPGAPFEEFKNMCRDYGVTYLENETIEIVKDEDSIKLTGLKYTNSTQHLCDNLHQADEDYFNVLLFHDSTKFDLVSQYGYDLVLCGHGHGGVIRIPFVGGLIAPDHSLFPKYDYGVYRENNSVMISSSGLGEARVPRWNNPRECVLITLNRDDVD